MSCVPPVHLQMGFAHQLLVARPVSCGGIDPAQFTAIRYWESTTRRSSSAPRESVQAEKSIAPPPSKMWTNAGAGIPHFRKRRNPPRHLLRRELNRQLDLFLTLGNQVEVMRFHVSNRAAAGQAAVAVYRVSSRMQSKVAPRSALVTLVS